MACYLLDWDGTIVSFGQTDLLPGAEALLASIQAQGSQIVVTTQRPCAGEIQEILDRLNIDAVVITGCVSPRIILNDMGAYAVSRKTDAGYSQKEIEKIVALGRS